MGRELHRYQRTGKQSPFPIEEPPTPKRTPPPVTPPTRRPLNPPIDEPPSPKDPDEPPAPPIGDPPRTTKPGHIRARPQDSAYAEPEISVAEWRRGIDDWVGVRDSRGQNLVMGSWIRLRLPHHWNRQ